VELLPVQKALHKDVRYFLACIQHHIVQDQLHDEPIPRKDAVVGTLAESLHQAAEQAFHLASSKLGHQLFVVV
jgi:hypothetical protein